MYKVGVIGDRDSIYGFAALGLVIYPEEDAQAAAVTLRRLAENGYAVVYMTEQLFSQLEREMDRYRDRLVPAVIPIPGVSGNTGIGEQNVRRAVEKAVGSDILFGSENESTLRSGGRDK